MSNGKVFCVIFTLSVFLGLTYVTSTKSVIAGQQAEEGDELSRNQETLGRVS